MSRTDPKLAEYSEHALRSELQQRANNRKVGRCDYCGRPFDSQPPCKHATRHSSTYADNLKSATFRILS